MRLQHFSSRILGLLFLTLPAMCAPTCALPERGAILGQVVDQEDRAVPGALITLTRNEDPPAHYRQVSVKCNRKGTFQVRLAPGIWQVRWAARGYYSSVPNDDGPIIRHPADPEVILGAGQTVELRLKMIPSSLLFGRVLGVGGRLVRNRTVRLVSARPERFVLEQAARTDDRGEFRLPFDYAGYETFCLLCPGLGYGVEQQVTLDAGKTTRVTYTLLPLASLEGRVTGSDGRTPAVAVNVFLDGGWPYVARIAENSGGLGPRITNIGVARPEVRSDRAGRFRFESLPGGEYSLTLTDADPKAPPVKLALRDGESQTGILLKLPAGMPDRPR